MPKPQWRHLAHRRESPDRGLTDPGTERRRRPQSDRDGERLVVVEEQRRPCRCRLRLLIPRLSTPTASCRTSRLYAQR